MVSPIDARAPHELWATANSTERSKMLRWVLGNLARNPKQMDAAISVLRSEGILMEGTLDENVARATKWLESREPVITPDRLRRHEVSPAEQRQIDAIMAKLSRIPDDPDPLATRRNRQTSYTRLVCRRNGFGSF